MDAGSGASRARRARRGRAHVTHVRSWILGRGEHPLVFFKKLYVKHVSVLVPYEKTL